MRSSCQDLLSAATVITSRRASSCPRYKLRDRLITKYSAGDTWQLLLMSQTDEIVQKEQRALNHSTGADEIHPRPQNPPLFSTVVDLFVPAGQKRNPSTYETPILSLFCWCTSQEHPADRSLVTWGLSPPVVPHPTLAP